MLCRGVLLLTQSFITPKPHAALLVLAAVVNIYLLVRFVHFHRRCFGRGKHNRATTLTLMMLVGAEVLLAFNPYFNMLGTMLPVLQIAVNFTTKRSAAHQNGVIMCFIAYMFLPVYYSLQDGNIFRVEPVRWVGWFMLVMMALQLVILKLQEHKKQLRSYLKRHKKSHQYGGVMEVDCPICLAPISNASVMTTACKHSFHEDCIR